MMFSCVCGADSVSDAGSAGEAGSAAFFVFDETASFREFCWLLLVMLIPMVPASFCR